MLEFWLKELRNMRIDLYTELSKKGHLSDDLGRKMFNEYHEFCIFNAAITKKP